MSETAVALSPVRLTSFIVVLTTRFIANLRRVVRGDSEAAGNIRTVQVSRIHTDHSSQSVCFAPPEAAQDRFLGSVSGVIEFSDSEDEMSRWGEQDDAETIALGNIDNHC